MDISIRPMVSDDWAEVVEIYYQGIQTNMATFETACPSYDVWDKGHLPSCRLVAEVDYDVAGWAALVPFSGRDCYSGVATVSIYIDANYRNRGVGEVLLTALLDETAKMGFWSIQSAIFQENLPSLKLHEKCGFRKIGYRERLGKDRFGVWRSVVLMEHRIQTDIAGGCDCDLVKVTGVEPIPPVDGCVRCF